MSIFRKLVDINVRASHAFDRLFPSRFRRDGNQDFLKRIVWEHVQPGQTVCDVGGGKQPFFSVDKVRELSLRVVGLDISAEELACAPAGAYSSTIAADICTFQGEQDADLVICQSLLEHVPDTRAALAAIASTLKPGGLCLLFVPCRNAPFARLNLLLPDAWKRRILFAVFPHTRHAQGFRSYYDRCTPSQFSAMAQEARLSLVELRRYHMSSYFSFFFPLFVVWRLWTLLTVAVAAGDLCETFSMVLRKDSGVVDAA